MSPMVVNRMVASLSLTVLAFSFGSAGWSQQAGRKETIHRCLLKIYQAQQSPEVAGEFSALLAIKPGDAQLHYEYGGFLLRSGNVAGGIAQFRKAAQLQPSNADFQGYLGQALMSTKDYDGAVTALRRACASGASAQNWPAKLQQALQYQLQARQYAQYQKDLKERESN
jgi:cytochrome c-type biogenesis protein CcmH/NrfG